MSVTKLTEFVNSFPGEAFAGVLRSPDGQPVRVEGLVASARAFFIAKIFQETGRSMLVLCTTAKAAEEIQDDLESFLGKEISKYFPHRESSIYDGHSPFGHTTEIRFEALDRLLREEPCIIITTMQALFQKIVHKKEFTRNILDLEVCQQVDLGELREELVRLGFSHAPVVEEIGQFSVRGGIIDIFPFLCDQPVRIELWGDEIESIRGFDVLTQRSSDKMERIHVPPMREFLLDEEEMEDGKDALREAFPSEPALDAFEKKLLLGEKDTGAEWHISWFKTQFSSLFDYLRDDSVFVEVQSGQNWKEQDKALRDLYKQCYSKAKSHGYVSYSKPEELLLSPEALEEEITKMPRVEVGYLPDSNDAVRFHVKEQPGYTSGVSSFRKELYQLRQDGYTVALMCDKAAQAERLGELLEEDAPHVKLLAGSVSRGFLLPEASLALYTDHQIFNRYARKVKYRKYKGGVSIPSFEALTPGDFVVHADHGIGRFHGIERVDAGDGSAKDCMVIIYADQNKLFVPVENFEKIQKYVAKEGTPPVLTKLGTASWDRLKKRTKKAIQEMAQDLLDLYAKRKYEKGHMFGEDTHWQKEFEDAFIYEETKDQLKAVAELKADMKKSVCMDRLICGDVGFGKTEVAVRAAFKCVMEGMQVAVLVPTTVLAAQHVKTLRERMADYPVRIGMLSRFVSQKEQKETVKKIEMGEVDITVGTHRLLSKDIRFKNLGLLIVDEEHRFGVRHKEKIKKMRVNVDVISMTATPIPRTLHMSLAGMRDISIINTPPRNRLSVQTRFMEFNEEVIQEAIEQELRREGQVYFVHNRVQSIQSFTELVERLVPAARVATAHGQMNPRDLEEVMDRFMQGHYDVLVSTDIIESGLDIANVNTLIINRADMFGLAQLYQLRGRVGRSSIQAYAYLLTPPVKHLKEDTVRRLKVLEQYTDLGSGFQIAMRDMELRGAGNLLGTQQHGFIAAVGFEMYMRLLKETIRELRGGQTEMKLDPKIDAGTESYIPESYIPDREQRISVYQTISQKETIQTVKEMDGELKDRFGETPKEVRALLSVMILKIIAKKRFFSRVALMSDRLLIEFSDETEHDQKSLGVLVDKIKRPFEFMYETPLKLSIELTEPDPFLRLQQAVKVIQGLE